MVNAAGLYPTTKELVSQYAFTIVIWFGVSLCAVVCILRFWIRLVCFRRLFVEDCLMVGAIAVLIASAVVMQIYIGDIYEIIHIQNGVAMPGPNFIDDIKSTLKCAAITLILHTVGLWLIKFNFMLLFYRLGYQIQSYRVLWWVAIVLVTSCGAVTIGLIPYNCLFGSVTRLTVECATTGSVKNIYTHYIATVVIDIFSDLIIIAFPILIIWKTGLNWRQKLMLSSIFLLVGFTISVTVVRGTVFGGVYKAVNDIDRQVMDISWMFFWYFVQYIVSFVIACLVSFRSLWSSKEERSRKRRIEAERQRIMMEARGSSEQSNENSKRSRWKKMSDSLLITVAHMEGTTVNRDRTGRLQLESHLATMNLDFSNWGNDSTDRDSTKSRDVTDNAQIGA